MINTLIRPLLVPPLLLILISCSSKNTEFDKLGEITCEQNNVFQIGNFINNWNAQKSENNKKTISSYTAASKGKPKKLKYCERAQKICLIVQTVGECVVGAKVVSVEEDSNDPNVSAMSRVTTDLVRRVMWGRLIKSFEPEISQAERTRLDNALYENIRTDDPSSSSSSQTDLIKYTAKYEGEDFVLEAFPLQYTD